MNENEALESVKQWMFENLLNVNIVEPPYGNYCFYGIDPDDYFIFSYGLKSDPLFVGSSPIIGVNKKDGLIMNLGRCGE